MSTKIDNIEAGGAECRSSAALFRPFAFKNLDLANRVVMAPMTREFSPDGMPGAEVAQYYRRRAEGGCGLLITEGTTIESPVASGYRNVPYFWGPALEGWKRVAEAVHAAGGAIMPQLWHVGHTRNPAKCPNPELPSQSPSGIGPKLEKVSEPMTIGEIHGTVEAFARAARHSKELGFDGVQFHGAHGYLIDQFFWHRTNLREDDYGGSLENRVRFAAEIISETRREVGPDFPILLRISQWKGVDYHAKNVETPKALECWLKPLVAAGVDMFDCSQRRFWEPEFPGSQLNLAGWVKKVTGIPSMTVGSVGLNGDFIGSVLRGENATANGIDELLDRLEADEFDLVAVGRALITDPAWAHKIREGLSGELLSFDASALLALK